MACWKLTLNIGRELQRSEGIRARTLSLLQNCRPPSADIVMSYMKVVLKGEKYLEMKLLSRAAGLCELICLLKQKLCGKARPLCDPVTGRNSWTL